jgi:hypothetical protein
MKNSFWFDFAKISYGMLIASIFWIFYIVGIYKDANNHGLGKYVYNHNPKEIKFQWAAPEVIVNGR